MASDLRAVHTPAVAFREDLDPLRCANGCQDHPIFMHSVCHPEDPVWVSYDKQSGTLLVECSICEQRIVCVKVASQHAMDVPAQRM